ncbi:hypothetical protein [Pararhizobium sp. PWRC1-1]|uniref:hypothetical protein n=1 Tax=Pararhizobium sp. PWRC1-1 TaxID=2804566 RepID=UPI003CF8062D
MKAEHLPFKGASYNQGINGKKVAVVGYSHWSEGEYPDNENFSAFTLDKVMDGSWKPRFHSTIRNAFGFTSHSDFWNRVLFFNYVPTMIGTKSQRFGTATDAEAKIANARFEHILDDHKPELVFVFTKKTQLGALGLNFEPLSEPLQAFVHAERTANGHTSKIVRLRHPQGANGRALKQTIAQALGNPDRRSEEATSPP